MTKCVYCKNETQLHENGTPICVSCAEARDAGRIPASNDRKALLNEVKIREVLRQDVLSTTATLNAASEEFTALLNDIPSGIPHPDGAQRIHQASRKLSAARKEMITAHSRLNDFLSRGVIPDELKRAAGEST